MERKIKVGLALGGGGVRALAHIGILKVFEQEGIPIDFIAGTSMGAILAANYALYRDITSLEHAINTLVEKRELRELETLARKSEPEEKELLMEKLALFVKELYLWNLRAVKKNLIDSSKIEPLIKFLVGDKKFEDTKIPFECIATDLLSGEEVTLDKGPLVPALLASSALPGVFPPVELKGRTLIDGGIITVVPIEPLRKMGADLVIAVDVDEGGSGSKFDHAMDVMFQADYIRTVELTRLKLLSADMVIRPDVKKISWASFSLADSCIKKGLQAAEKSLDQIRNKIQEKEKESEIKEPASERKKCPLWKKLSGLFCRSK